MYEIEMSKSGIRSYEEATSTRFEMGQSRLGMGMFMSAAALFGVWGVTCLVNGLSQAGSMQELGRSLLMAITGI